MAFINVPGNLKEVVKNAAEKIMGMHDALGGGTGSQVASAVQGSAKVPGAVQMDNKPVDVKEALRLAGVPMSEHSNLV